MPSIVRRADRRRHTETRVLLEARRLFSELGYDRTTIRKVAVAANTDPSLVMRYFGSKAELFTHAAHLSIEETPAGTGVIAEQLLAALMTKLESEPTATLAMLRSMLTHPDAATEVRESIARQQRQLADTVDAANPALRIALSGSITLGVIIGRYLLELDGLRDAAPDEIADLLRPCFHALTLTTTAPARTRRPAKPSQAAAD